MEAILLFFKSLSPTTWIMGGMGVVIAILCGLLAFARVEVNFISQQKEALALQVTNLQTVNKTCIDSVKTQNTAIEQLNSNTKDLTVRMSNVASGIKQNDMRVRTIIDEINKKTVAKDCPGAMIELRQFTKAFTSDWNKK